MSEFTKNGGKWLGAVRSHVQWKFRNGEAVTWGSNDVLEPHATISQIEEIAAIAVDTALPEVDRLNEQIKELRKKLLRAINTTKETAMYDVILAPRYVPVTGPSSPALVLKYDNQRDADLVADALRRTSQVRYMGVDVIPSKEVDVNNLLLNMFSGLRPKDLQPDEVKALVKRHGDDWFKVLGYTEPKYTKP